MISNRCHSSSRCVEARGHVPTKKLNKITTGTSNFAAKPNAERSIFLQWKFALTNQFLVMETTV